MKIEQLLKNMNRGPSSIPHITGSKEAAYTVGWHDAIDEISRYIDFKLPVYKDGEEVVVDFERKGNMVRFSFGKDLENAWGDDWDDMTYSINGDPVYSEYVDYTVDIPFRFDDFVLSPSEYKKEDLKHRKMPCIIVVPPSVHEYSYAYDYDYNHWLGADGIVKIYFGDTEEEINRQVKKYA